jgi:hypothetical protein
LGCWGEAEAELLVGMGIDGLCCFVKATTAICGCRACST